MPAFSSRSKLKMLLAEHAAASSAADLLGDRTRGAPRRGESIGDDGMATSFVRRLEGLCTSSSLPGRYCCRCRAARRIMAPFRCCSSRCAARRGARQPRRTHSPGCGARARLRRRCCRCSAIEHPPLGPVCQTQLHQPFQQLIVGIPAARADSAKSSAASRLGLALASSTNTCPCAVTRKSMRA